jgi:small subunit ribosomal protein S16
MMRVGRKHQPFYRVVVVPRTQKPGRSKYVEKLGWVDPLHHKQELNTDRAKYWLGVGAQPSDTVWNLFVREGLVEGGKRKKGKSGIAKAEEPQEEAPAAEAPAEEAADGAEAPAETETETGAPAEEVKEEAAA